MSRISSCSRHIVCCLGECGYKTSMSFLVPFQDLYRTFSRKISRSYENPKTRTDPSAISRGPFSFRQSPKSKNNPLKTPEKHPRLTKGSIRSRPEGRMDGRSSSRPLRPWHFPSPSSPCPSSPASPWPPSAQDGSWPCAGASRPPGTACCSTCWGRGC